MQKWRLALVVLLSIGPLIAQAAPRLLSLAPRGSQVHTYSQGVPWLASDGEVSVGFSVEPVSKKRLRVDIVIVNSSATPITVMDSSITASSGGKSLKTFGYDALLAEEKRRRMWEGVAMGLAAGANAYNASQQGYYNQYGTVHGTYNNYGKSGYSQGTFSGSVVVSGYDAAAASAAMTNANFQNAQLFGALEAQHANRGAALESSIFRSQTIAPGQSYGGALQVELPRKAKRGSNHQLDVVVGSLATFTVFVDAAPTEAQLANLPQPEPVLAAAVQSAPEPPQAGPQLIAVTAERVTRASVMQAVPQIQGAIRNISRERTRGSTKRAYVFFDVDWTVAEELASRTRVDGTVTLLDEHGRSRLRMPWYLEREPALGTSFVEEGVGVALDDAGDAADWLRAVMPDQIKIEYTLDGSE